ncbi:MAG: SDR family oxidoreductase [Hyphomicrobiales bacterium]
MLQSGTRALVTGGSGGLGSETVRMLARHGVHTIALSNDAPKLAALEGIENVEPVLLDVTDDRALKARFANERIDIVVNAAAMLGMTGTIWSTATDEARRLLDVNIVGIQAVLAATVPGMVERNRGHIVNIGSIAGPYPSTGQPIYSVTKAAVHSISSNLRMELFGTDVRVTELRPGRVRTGMHAEMFGGDYSKSDALFYDPYKCLMPEDIAEAIRYVLSAPPHVCIAQMEIVPTHQVVGGTRMYSRNAPRT